MVSSFKKGCDMQEKLMPLKPVDVQNVSFDDMSADTVREHVHKATQDFKNSWRNLAQAIHVVWREKLYRKWGYEKFDHYTAKEVHIRKHTAMKLIRSYAFLEKEEPAYLEANYSQDQTEKAMPNFEAVSTLQRAKKALGDEEYQKVKKDLFDKGKDPREVKKDLTALILKRRKDLNPEEERTRQVKVSLNRFLATLRTFKRDIEVLEMLPASIAGEIDSLIKRIEKHT